MGEGANITQSNSGGRSALHLAGKSRNTKIMIQLLKEIRKDSYIFKSAGKMLDVVQIRLKAITGDLRRVSGI